jgi:type VII secretion-associated protein (TIGR03931 family)
MPAHQMVIEAGPGAVRRLCCSTEAVADIESADAALEAIDDTMTLVDEQPVAVAELWHSVLKSLACPGRQTPETVLVVYPSWWSESRVDVVATGARTITENVVTRARSELLAPAEPATAAKVVVEIATGLVAITTAATIAEPRIGPPQQVAEAVVRRIVALTRGEAAAVIIDGPASISGAVALVAVIAERLRSAAPDAHVQVIGDARLVRLAAPAPPVKIEPAHPEPARPQRVPALTAFGVVAVLACAVLGAGIYSRQGTPAPEVIGSTFLVEGRVALQVPAQWAVQRITVGPGSARVQVISPSDPQTVLHVTQSPVPVAALSATAETLQRALERANATEPAGVFVDFNPAGHAADRPAVTYREVRQAHHIDWVVLVDGGVRISIGCQSRPGAADAIRAVCEQAVRSARTVR